MVEIMKKYFLIIVGLLLIVKCGKVFSAPLAADDLSIKLETDKIRYRVYDDINYSVIITPSVPGEIVSRDTTLIEIEIYQLETLDGSFSSIDDLDVAWGRLDNLDENSYYIPPAFEYENGVRVPPDPEFITITPTEPFRIDSTVNDSIYTEGERFGFYELIPGFYAIVVNYIVDFPGESSLLNISPYTKTASTNIQITTENDIQASIDYWLSILQDESATNFQVKSAWNNIRGYTFHRFYTSLDDVSMESRRRGVKEYQLWYEYVKNDVAIVLEEGEEYLIGPGDRRCVSCYDGADIKVTQDFPSQTTEASVDLSGMVDVRYAGLKALEIVNNLLPSATIPFERTSFKSWSANVPLTVGENKITLKTTDYINYSEQTSIKITRIEEP